MKATLEIPDGIFRRAKSAATHRGVPLHEIVTQAVREKLAAGSTSPERPWLKHTGKLKHLHAETGRINRLIEEGSEKIDAEM